MKKIVMTIILGSVLVAFPAFAAPDVMNLDTGPGSTNNAALFTEYVERVVNNNSASIINNVEVSLETGSNQASQNASEAVSLSSVGKITSGKSSFTATIENIVNTNRTFITKQLNKSGGGLGGGSGNPTAPIVAKVRSIAATLALPAAGVDSFNNACALFGIPLLMTMLIRIGDIKKSQMSA